MKNSNWAETAVVASGVAATVLALVWLSEFSILFTRSAHKKAQSRQLSQLGPTIIAPKSLALVAEGFRIGVRVEAPEFPIDDVTNLKAWDQLQTTLTAYAQRLDLLVTQGRELDKLLRERHVWMATSMLICFIVMLVFTIRLRAIALKSRL